MINIDHHIRKQLIICAEQLLAALYDKNNKTKVNMRGR